jgi:signal transduction histidine kinase
VVLGAAGVAALTGWYALSVPRWYADVERVTDLLMLTVGAILAVSMAAVAVGQVDARARLQAALDEVTASAARVAELSAATERNRLARDIHDSLGHHLTAIAVQLEKATAFRGRDPAVADRAVLDARGSTRRALEEVRRSVRTLRADSAPFSLSAGLAELARQAGDDEFRVQVAVAGSEDRHEVPARVALYRAAQEGLTNARRHGRASQVRISVRFDDRAATLVVSDDGCGLQPATGPATGFGLSGMRERVQLLGGQVDVAGRPGEGVTITVLVPRVAA